MLISIYFLGHHSYKSIPLAYITNELAFDDFTAAHEFLSKYGAAAYVPEPPPPPITAKPISISLTAPPKIVRPTLATSNAIAVANKIYLQEEEKRILDCKAAQGPITFASQTFQKVDIKVRQALL